MRLMLFPAEIRNNIYQHLIKWGRQYLNHAYLFSTYINCYVPVCLLLVNKTFSSELLYIFSSSLKLSLSLSSVFYHVPSLLNNLPSIIRTSTRELYVHIRKTTSAECMLHWHFRCNAFPESLVTKQAIFLLRDVDFSLLSQVQLNIDVPKDYRTNRVMYNICSLWPMEEIDTSIRYDKWHGLLYQKVEMCLHKNSKKVKVIAMVCYS